MYELSEKDIIRKIQKGQINYFEYFVEKYSKVVFYYVYVRVSNNKQDAEDIVQNAFIKVYQALDRFDPRKKFYPYFFTIIKNEIIEFYRKNKKHSDLSESLIAEEKETNLDFDFLVGRLKPEYRKVLELYFADGFSYEQIGKKMGKNINTIKTLIRRAKEAVRKNLTNK